MIEILSPLSRYHHALESGQFILDPVQEAAVQALNQLWSELIAEDKASKKRFSFLRRRSIPKGVYMWGGVGRGKTWLMDQFFDALPFERKMRLHFHHFMQYVHQELNRYVGQKNPLERVADQIYSQASIICFDEFFVSSVPDAMILSDLFQMLFKRGMSLVATSNIMPDGLYKDGLHRDRFLPVIELIKQQCHILNVDAGIDYRLRILKQADLFKYPLSEQTGLWLKSRFNALAQSQKVSTDDIDINHRQVVALARTEDVLWCDFSELCFKPRSPADFIQIAHQYHTVLLSDIPELTDQFADATRRFIYLVDEFYDCGVKLIITSHDSILTLYHGEKLSFEIERTRSRLLEMQSDEYLNKQHRKV